MLYLVLMIGILLVVLDRTYRGGKIRLLRLDLEFKLFALRDQLRLDAINDESPYNNWFDYMDTTLTRTIGAIDTINPWRIVAFVYFHRKESAKILTSVDRLKETLHTEENHRIGRIYDEYVHYVAEYLKGRYRLSWPLAAIFFVLLTRDPNAIHQSIEQKERELAPVISIAPDTSTFRKYGHQGTVPQPA